MKKIRIPSLRLLTKRLELRPLQMRDDRAWMASHCAMRPPQSSWDIPRIPLQELSFSAFMETLNQHKQESQNDQKYTLGIFHKEIGTLLGYLFIQDIHRGELATATLDFRIINVYCNKGFAKEAVNEAIKLKAKLRLETLHINPKSCSRLKL